MGCPVNGVQSRLLRLRARLRPAEVDNLLGSYGPARDLQRSWESDMPGTSSAISPDDELTFTRRGR
jgi:hypothetical protein